MSDNSKKNTQSLTDGYRGNGVQIPTYSKPAPMPKKVTPVSGNSKPTSTNEK